MATAQQNWFAHRRWGVFCHYLDSLQNGGGFHNTAGVPTDWDSCLADFDVRRFAQQMHEINAGYVIFTLMQGSRYLCAPNETYDRLTGYAPGEAAGSRDLILALSDALAAVGIPLFLYYTGDGPHLDAKAMEGLYGRTPDGRLPDIGLEKDAVTDGFIANWCAVLREYSLRYAGRISGWWVDGLYDTIGYTPQRIAAFRDAAKAGNPEALFAANYYGCLKNAREVRVEGIGTLVEGDFYHTLAPPTPLCDYTAGEVVTLDVFPRAQLLEGAQAHVLSFLGIPPRPIEVYAGWAARGCKYSIEYLMRYVRQVNACGGVVSLDVCLYRDGHVDPEQLRVLKMLGNLRPRN